jgi:hypothetical protein
MVAMSSANERARIDGRIALWNAEADRVESKLKREVAMYSDRAVGEAQGYVRALRKCAEDLRRSLKDVRA